jgi:serine/threonine-protein kinase
MSESSAENTAALPASTRSWPPPPAGLSPDLLPERYRLEEEVARGGMGLIVRVHDRVLGRSLALKAIHEHLAGHPDMARRFLDEARIAAGLQHPGVAPIHDLDQLADGRPFFTMKLVQGRTLADLLEQRTSPSDDLPRFLLVFEQLAQTLGYAHAMGVIHRDLKPANVMVGGFGEVQVMDWGLAKVLATPAKPQAAEFAACGLASPDATQAGSVLGTPAFMPPEQARGEIDRLDERADVFGLGAILHVILTGQPLYHGDSTAALVRQAQQGDLGAAFQCLDGCGADPEVIALARACLAAEPERRPRNAGAVARAVAEHRAAVERRLRSAEQERAAAEVRAEKARAVAGAERRLRRRTVGLAAALLLLVLAGTAGGVWWLRQRDQAVQAATLALEECLSLGAKGRWPAAVEAARRAETLLPPLGAPASLRQRVRTARVDAEMVRDLEEVRLSHADVMEKDHFGFRTLHARYEKAFRGYGLDVLEEEAEEVAGRIRDSAIRDHLVLALDDWARSWLQSDPGRTGRLLIVASRADPDPWRNAVRHPETWTNPDLLKRLARRPEALEQPPGCLSLVADVLGRLLHSPDDAVELLRAAQRRHPDNFWLNHDLAFYLQSLTPPRPEEAAAFYRAALAVRPDSPGVHHNLGRALHLLGRREDAEAHFRRAIALQPGYSFAHNNLAVLLIDRGRHAEAETEARRALAANPSNTRARYNLGRLFRLRGDRAGAIACWRLVVTLEPDAARVHADMGLAHYQLGQLRAARASFREAVRLNPTNDVACGNLGLVLSDMGRQEEALPWFDEALRLAPRQPIVHKNRGLAYARMGRHADAIRDYQEAIRLRPHDGQAYSNLTASLFATGRLPEAHAAGTLAVRLAPGLADAHFNLGLVLGALDKPGHAAHAFRRAAELRPDRANAFHHLTRALALLGRWPQVADVARRGLALAPDDALMHMNLGLALMIAGRLADADSHLRRAVELAPDSALAHGNLGVARMRQGQLADAEHHLRAAVRLEPRAANAHCDLGTVLMQRGAYREAADHLRKATELNPGYIDAYHDLGTALRELGEFVRAVEAFQRALKLLSPGDERRAAFDQELVTAKKLAAADAKLPAILGGKAEPADLGERLLLAQICRQRGRYADAARFFAEVIASPELRGRIPRGLRLAAACVAARAARDTGRQVELRRCALGWLRADLAVWRKFAEQGDSADRQQVREEMRRWLEVDDLAGLRGAALDKLPEEERAAWRQFWAEVRALQ